MEIKNEKDLDFAWFFVHYTENKLLDVVDREKAEEKIKEYKKAIREYNHKQEQEKDGEYTVTILEPWNCEYYVELICLPKTVQTEEQAESYFNRNIEMYIEPTLYNMEYETGRECTIRHKTCQRNGRFYIYHFVGAFNI